MVTKKTSHTHAKKTSTNTIHKKRKSTTAGQEKVKTIMREYKRGELRSGSKSGPKVKSRKQAVAIALSEARKHGAKIPQKSERATSKKS